MIIRFNTINRFKWLIILVGIFSAMRIYRNSFNYSSTQQGGIWNIITILFMVFALLHLMKQKMCYSKPIKVLLAYSLFVIINGLITMQSLTLNGIYYLLMIPYFVYVTICFSTVSHEPDRKSIFLVRFIFFTIWILGMSSIVGFRLGFLHFSMVADAYYVLCMLPLLLMYESSNSIKLLGTICTGVLIAFSLKRVGFIAYIIILLLFYYYEDNGKSVKNKFFTIFKIAILFAVLYIGYLYLAKAYHLTLLERMANLSEDGGSGRDFFYKTIIINYFNSDFLTQLFGHGRDTLSNILVRHSVHSSAHDDFLEVLYNYGFLPAILLLSYYISLIAEWKQMRKLKYPKANVYIAGVSCSLLMSLFSTYCVAFAYVTCGAAFIGYSLGDWQRYKTGVNLQ